MLIDATTLLHGEHADTYVDLGLDIDLPSRRSGAWPPRPTSGRPVITAANGINLHLGRSKRLASRDQRRILRVMYPTCAMPGCQMPFDKTDIHHINWYGPNHGRTDIDDLAPGLPQRPPPHPPRRHRRTIDPQRTLTLTHPDGTTMTTGPPKRGAG